MLVWLLLRKTGGAEMTTTISVTVTCHYSFKVELESYRNRYTWRCYKLNSLYLDLCCIFGGLISNFHAPPPPTTLFIALFLQAASTKTIFLKTNGKNVPWNILEGISLYEKQNSLTIIIQWSLYLANIHGNITSVYINGGCLYHKSLGRVMHTSVILLNLKSY